jgi:hypothetical protein
VIAAGIQRSGTATTSTESTSQPIWMRTIYSRMASTSSRNRSNSIGAAGAKAATAASAPTNRRALIGCSSPDGNTVARDDEGLPAIERAHDLAAAVAQLSLGDLARHGIIVLHGGRDS